ncbi:hypothetical protein Nepgr_008305 [Nepenthes gracilis]|uniref:LysM domain receptor-like kinase 4 n=1 Tax=Nepenthes gracilis TaxID=150966 RepID=A0AAD3XJ94_NEPGR|nr:hypothetical protein Nepgr_008305 [Nepenthes gracilis]
MCLFPSVYIFIFSLTSFSSLIAGQQPYATSNCGGRNSPSALGYNCNGVKRSCHAYLLFRAQTPYTTISSIAGLLSSDPFQLSQINNVSKDAKLLTNHAVIVPVNCSCAGQYYQTNMTYVVEANDTPYTIANNTLEGLSTCQAIQNQRSGLVVDIFPGERLTIPIRCACPTKNQAEGGVKFLLTYIIKTGDAISSIAVRFGADVGRTLQANEKSEQNSVIYPFTTLLVPLQSPPNSSQIAKGASPLSSQVSPSPQSPFSSPPNNLRKRWDYFGAGVAAGGAFMLGIGAIIFYLITRKFEKKNKPLMSSMSSEAPEKAPLKKSEVELPRFMDLESIPSIAQSIKVYTIKDLQSATENFSPNRWIKGSVYQGIINGEQVAIKRKDGDSATTEINLLNKINHFNLLSLLGVCFHEGQWYLVHEYAANGSLSDWIYHGNEDDGKLLTWTQRIQISLDIATGLDYLHSYTTPAHVHKDIKSSNVLLDADFRAKVANLGQSKTVEQGHFALTRHIVGTKGYMAPEYLENGLITTKLDVYSYGVLMLEILTGKEVATLYEETTACLSEVLEAVLCEDEYDGKENLTPLIDPSLQGHYPAEVAMAVVRLADGCLRKDAGSRPPMNEIVKVLSRALTTSLIWESTSTSESQQPEP